MGAMLRLEHTLTVLVHNPMISTVLLELIHAVQRRTIHPHPAHHGNTPMATSHPNNNNNNNSSKVDHLVLSWEPV
jgi:hypothetical protein